MKTTPFNLLNRRSFLSRSTLAASAIVSGASFRLALSARAQSTRPGNPLRLLPEWSGGTLTAAPATVAVWPGYPGPVLTLNGSIPGPTIRARRGEWFTARIDNQLGEPLVLHWHGILAPERMDGHPRDGVASGQSYGVHFPIRNRAGTYWYHAHTDALTASQAYRGMAGAFIVEDPAEAALDLPAGNHDLVLVLTDKRSNAARQLIYSPTMMDTMSGYLGDVVLVNGTPDAWLSVDRGRYRLRLVNGSNARIFKLGLSAGRALQLIATDGGLFPAPVTVTTLMLAPGQRADIVVDFAPYSVGQSVVLRSFSFPASGGMMGGPRQGTEFDVLRFYVDGAATGAPPVPATLSAITPLDPALAQRTRVFTLAMSGMVHTINGLLFSLNRVDFTVPFGQLELWEIRNTSTEFHPMHVHGALFQVSYRSSTATLAPEDTGWKDTVLVSPNETVRLLVNFDSYPGVFLFHCHNLEHEDSGMMLNFEVTGPPPVKLETSRAGTNHVISYPQSAADYTLEHTPRLGTNAVWQPASQAPVLDDAALKFTVPRTGTGFFRLRKP